MSHGDRITATKTAFEILDEIHAAQGASAAELVAATDLSRAGVYKHLRTLADVDAVENRDGVYVLGPKFTEYSLEVTGDQSDIYQSDKVDELARSLDAPTNLWMHDEGRCRCVYTTYADDREGYPRSRGDSERLVESAPGKVILAHLPSDERDGLVDSEDDALSAQLETLRERQLLEEALPSAPEWVAIATPVLDPSDYPVGAIEVVIPSKRADGIDVKNNISGLLTETANRMRVEML